MASHDAPGAEACNEASPRRRESTKISHNETAWYLLQIGPEAELHIKPWLRKLGIEFVEFEHKITRRKKQPLRVPTFPGYLFLRMKLSDDWWFELSQMGGVVKLVNIGASKPTPLPRGAFERLQSQHARLFTKAQSVSVVKGILAGEELSIVLGPLTGLVVISLTDEVFGEVEVSANIFGRHTVAKMKVADVERRKSKSASPV